MGTLAAGSSGFAAPAPSIEPRILAQEGLAIALASTVLQSQLDVLLFASSQVNECKPQPDGHSVEATKFVKVSSTVSDADVTVFFDHACTKPYVQAAATITQTSTAKTITETASYFGTHGQALGSLSLTESLTPMGRDGVVIGTGTFAPANGAQKVSLGLTCTLHPNVAPFYCEGGIAQTFPALKLSLASVTPLRLVPKKMAGGGIGAVTFSGSSSTMETGSPGALSIIKATPSTLGISGSGASYGSVVTQGKAAKFSLFPPKPTSWEVTDTPHDAVFSIAVVSNVTRASSATVKTISSGATLATISVDQSGTGAIAYSDGTRRLITSWLLAD